MFHDVSPRVRARMEFPERADRLDRSDGTSRLSSRSCERRWTIRASMRCSYPSGVGSCSAGGWEGGSKGGAQHEARKYAEGRGVRLEIRNKTVREQAKKLAAIKMAN